MGSETSGYHEEKMKAVPIYDEFVKETAIFPPQFGILYCALKLTGEAGEVSEKLGKLIRDSGVYKQDNVVSLEPGQHIDAKWGEIKLSEAQLMKVTPRFDLTEEQKLALMKELGDVLWYVTAMSQQLGFSLERVMDMNIEKLTSRRERGVLKGSGDDR